MMTCLEYSSNPGAFEERIVPKDALNRFIEIFLLYYLSGARGTAPFAKAGDANGAEEFPRWAARHAALAG
jgi:hypothetical protein